MTGRFHPRRRVLRVGALLAPAVVLLGPSGSAWAHGGADRSGYSNYRSVVLSVSPAVPGLEVRTTGVEGVIELVNRSGREVVVLGYGGEPYLRIGAAGVEANLNSPATYVNGRQDADVPVPERATSSTLPEWFRLTRGITAHWHDHRAHWMGSVPPEAVRAAPGVRQVIYPAWTIPLVVDGSGVTVTGRLDWVPPPHRSLWFLVAVTAFVGAAALLQVPRRGRLAALVLGSTGLLAALLVAISRSTVERIGVGQRIGCYSAALSVALLLLLGRRRPQHDPPMAWGAAGLGLLATAVAYAKFLSYSQAAGTLPPVLGRVCVVVMFATGSALVVTSAVLAGERLAARRRSGRTEAGAPELSRSDS